MSSLPSPAPYAHWMLREMYEQPDALAETLAAAVEGTAFRDDLCEPIRQWLSETGHELVIAASGSSRHAGLAAELFIESRSQLAVDVEYASEYSYRDSETVKHAPVLVISQSGETVDTLAALRQAARAGNRTMAITNVPSSTMAREADVSFPTLAGRERAVPATKSFTAQLLNLYLLSLLNAEVQGTRSTEAIGACLAELQTLPDRLREQLPGWDVAAREVATHLASSQSFLYLGREMHYPIAREGALKLKESSYLHAEGYPAGELKHGPNALVGPQTPLVMIATCNRGNSSSVQRYDKMVQLMADMREQGATILAVANQGDSTVTELADWTLPVAEMSDEALTIAEVIPLQMLAYHIAVARGIDVDSPRNLSKAVLAE